MSIQNTMIGAEITTFDNAVLDSIIEGTVETLSLDVEDILISYAFRNCSKLIAVELINIRRFTGVRAFNYCESLRTIIIRTPDIVPPLPDAYTFLGSPIYSLDGVIYVPDNLLEEYKKATYWSSLASIMKGLSEL